MEDNLKYIRYARKSSEAKERQALSIPEQKAECQKYALKENLRVAYAFEESKTAFKPRKRPSFDKMVELITTGKANAIITWHLNRIARNPEEGGKILQLLQDGILKEIRTASGEIYTTESDHLILQIHLGMANQYSRNISKDVKRSLNHKVEIGEYPRQAVIGYEGFGERGSRNIRPHPIEAPLIRTVFDMMASCKCSLGTIVNFLADKGLRTKKGKKIGKSHLASILVNPVYYGYFYHKDILYKGNFEPIVSKKLFDDAQNAMHDRSRPKPKTHFFAFTGEMKCGTCGCAITASEKKKYYRRTNHHAIYIYYHCTKRRGKCPEKPIAVPKLEKQFQKILEGISIDKEVWDLGIKLLKTKYEEEANLQTDRRKGFQADFNRIQSDLDKLLTIRMNEEITAEEYATKKKVLLDEQARIESLLTDNSESSKTWLELAEEFFNTAYQAREMINSDDLEAKRKVIQDVGWNLILHDKKVKFSFKEPYDILLVPEYRQSVLPRVDSNHEPSS